MGLLTMFRRNSRTRIRRKWSSPPPSPPDSNSPVKAWDGRTSAAETTGPAASKSKPAVESVFDVHPTHRDFKPIQELFLPSATVYTLALLGPMLLPWDADASGTLPNFWFTCWSVFQRSYMVLLYAITMEMFIMYQLSDLVFSGGNECGAHIFFFLKLACNSVFTGFVLAELFETMSMIDWIRHAPDAHPDSLREWWKENCLSKQKKKSLRERPRFTGIEMKRLADNKEEFDPDWGIPMGYKLFCLIVLLVPKLCLGVFTWVIGTAFIALSETNTDLILNTLAVGFVQDIDEIVFMFTTSLGMQEAIANMPPVKLRDLRAKMRTRKNLTAVLPVTSTGESAVSPETPNAMSGRSASLVTSVGDGIEAVGEAAGEAMEVAANLDASDSIAFTDKMILWLQATGTFKVVMLAATTIIAYYSDFVLCVQIFIPLEQGSGMGSGMVV